MAALHLLLHFIRRDIRNRYLGSFSGGLWALLQPLIQLAVYGFVFVHIFKVQVPGANAPGYVPFLAMALWPWIAFSEGLTRATSAIHDNAALIGKVALPSEVFVAASVAATFLVNGFGFCAIVIALWLFGVPIDLFALPLAVLELAQMFVLALGLGFLLAALNVFVRDLAPALPQLLMLWMYASPILYARASLPERYQGLMDWNPVTHYTEFFRATLLGAGTTSLRGSLIAFAVSLLVFALGTAAFRRLKPHFEDFL